MRLPGKGFSGDPDASFRGFQNPIVPGLFKKSLACFLHGMICIILLNVAVLGGL
jgi:hypothetical protein